MSLLFGAYQYLDKSELEKRRLQYEIREKERKNEANISVTYIDTDFRSVYEIGGSDFTGWLSYLEKEKVLPFTARLRIQETASYKEVQGTQRGSVTFLLIRNAGHSEATNIDLMFDAEGKPEAKPEAVRIDRLDPDTGVMFLINHFDGQTQKSFGTAMQAGPELTYFDGFLKENKTAAVRRKNRTATISSPTVLMGR